MTGGTRGGAQTIMATEYLYEMHGGTAFGYFSGKYLYTIQGECTHYRQGKYLYTMSGGNCEFYQSGKYFYTMHGGQCRWYTT
jgi:hypothetical protein